VILPISPFFRHALCSPRKIEIGGNIRSNRLYDIARQKYGSIAISRSNRLIVDTFKLYVSGNIGMKAHFFNKKGDKNAVDVKKIKR